MYIEKTQPCFMIFGLNGDNCIKRLQTIELFTTNNHKCIPMKGSAYSNLWSASKYSPNQIIVSDNKKIKRRKFE